MLYFYGIQNNFLSHNYKLNRVKVMYEDEGLGRGLVIRGSNIQPGIWGSFGFWKVIEA